MASPGHSGRAKEGPFSQTREVRGSLVEDRQELERHGGWGKGYGGGWEETEEEAGEVGGVGTCPGFYLVIFHRDHW